MLDDDGIGGTVIPDLRKCNIDASLEKALVPENPVLTGSSFEPVRIHRIAGENDEHFPQTVNAPTRCSRIIDCGREGLECDILHALIAKFDILLGCALISDRK